MRQYPIWNDIHARGGRESPSNFGACGGFQQHVYVGTSSANSHLLAKIEVEQNFQQNGTTSFTLYVDGVLIKRGILKGKEFAIDS